MRWRLGNHGRSSLWILLPKRRLRVHFSLFGLCVLWLLSSPGLPQDLQITYQVGIFQPAKRVIEVKAVLHGLPEGTAVLRLPGEANDSEAGKVRLSELDLQDLNGDALPFEVEGGSLTFENNDTRELGASYQVKLQALPNSLHLSYMDESRGLISSKDLQLVVGETLPPAELHFQLPSGWKIISPTEKLGPNTYGVLSGESAIFYLGRANELRTTINSIPMVLAIEKGWPLESEETLKDLKRSIKYLSKTSQEWQAQPSFVVLLGDHTDKKKIKEASLHEGEFLVLTAPSGTENPNEMLRLFRYRLAGAMMQCYLPFLDAVPSSDVTLSLREYLTQKVLLKTGAISRDQFLDEMARGFAGEPDDSHEIRFLATRSGKPPASAQVRSMQRRILVGFLIDLSLSFTPTRVISIFDFIKDTYRSARESERIESELLKRSHTEKGYRNLLRFLEGESSPELCSDLLKPYGLLLVRSEMPRLGFSLSESFRILRLAKQEAKGRSPVQIGDKLIAIDDFHLVKPEDLIKARSLIGTNLQAVITLERDGNLLKVKQNLGREILIKLELNKLADADKQERLESLLMKEVED